MIRNRYDKTTVPRRKLRVLYVLHCLARAGTEMLVADLARKNRDRIDPAVACLDDEGPLAGSLRSVGIDVYLTHRRAGIDMSQVTRMIKIIRTFNPDVIHCHQYSPFFYTSLAVMIVTPRPVLFTEHGCHDHEHIGRKRRAANRVLARRVGHITAVCRFTRDHLIVNEGLPADKIEVVYNGIDVGQFDPAIDPHHPRRQLGLPADAPVVMQVGTFRTVKDQATAIHAWTAVRRHRPDAVLVFVGDGPDLPPCRHLADRLGFNGAVRFLAQRDDVPELLPAADVVLATSLSEAHSLSLLEAMAAERPVVATRVGGNPETVVHGETGLLVPPRDPHAVAGALVRLLDAPDLCRRMGRAGRRRVRDRFQQRDMHRRYLHIYADLAQRRSRP